MGSLKILAWPECNGHIFLCKMVDAIFNLRKMTHEIKLQISESSAVNVPSLRHVDNFEVATSGGSYCSMLQRGFIQRLSVLGAS